MEPIKSLDTILLAIANYRLNQDEKALKESLTLFADALESDDIDEAAKIIAEINNTIEEKAEEEENVVEMDDFDLEEDEGIEEADKEEEDEDDVEVISMDDEEEEEDIIVNEEEEDEEENEAEEDDEEIEEEEDEIEVPVEASLKVKRMANIIASKNSPLAKIVAKRLLNSIE